MQKREKVGKIATDLLAKDFKPMNSYELTNEIMRKDFIPGIGECIERHITLFKGIPFYIVAGFRGIKHIPNAQRFQFWARETCPLPTNDQAVYYYDPRSDYIEEMWSIPDRNTCKYLMDNALMLSPEEWPLLQYVLDYKDGTLDRKAVDRDKIRISMGLEV